MEAALRQRNACALFQDVIVVVAIRLERPQRLQTEGVNGPHIHVAESRVLPVPRSLLQPSANPELHLLGRPLGEGEGYDSRRVHGVDPGPPRDPTRHDLGLAGPRSGDDKQSTLVGSDGARLFLGKFPQDDVSGFRHRRPIRT